MEAQIKKSSESAKEAVGTLASHGQQVRNNIARISALETRKGVPHGPPIFNIVAQEKKILKLESLPDAHDVAAVEPVTLQAVSPVVLPGLKPAAQTLLTASAAQYGQLTAQERSDFGLRNGLMLAVEFEKLTPSARMSAIKSGVKTVNTLSTPAPIIPAAAGQKVITRAQFELKNKEDRMAHIKSGGQVID